MFICFKNSNIEGNPGRRASYLISEDAKSHITSLFFFICISSSIISQTT